MMNQTADHYADKTILVTGGAGAIGSNLAGSLADLGCQVVIIDDLSAAHEWNVPQRPNVNFIRGSVLDEEALRSAFSHRPNIVFHLAALFANQNSIDHPETDLMVNGLGTLRVLQNAQISGVERVVYASSGCSVYGSEAPFPLTEGFISENLDTPYQITKLLGELYSNFYRNYYALEVVRARFFNSYGPGEIPGRYRNVIPNFFYWALLGETLPITGTGEETRDWTFVGDIVRGLLLCGRDAQAPGEAFNLASGRETKVIDLANLINGITENPAKLEILERRRWDTHSRRLASIEKASSQLGYSPETQLEEGLVQTFSWFKDNWEIIRRSTDH